MSVDPSSAANIGNYSESSKIIALFFAVSYVNALSRHDDTTAREHERFHRLTRDRAHARGSGLTLKEATHPTHPTLRRGGCRQGRMGRMGRFFLP